MKLAGKVAIITGAGRGIGEAIALAFAREGATIVMAARTAEQLARVEAEVRSIGASVSTEATDVSNQDDVGRLVRGAVAKWGGIDILVNAAGVQGRVGPTWDLPVDDWIRTVNINLCGTFMACHEAVPHMIARGGGRIINFSGGGATAPRPGFSAYAAAKAAIVRFTETLAQETVDHNICVNAIAPGLVDTAMLDEVLRAGEDAGRDLAVVRRLRATGEGGTPRELPADLAVFLASEQSRGLTGKLISAPHDGWQNWDAARIEELVALPWFTLRRMDTFTLRPFLNDMKDRDERRGAAPHD